MSGSTGDKYGNTDFDRVPSGPYKGKRWVDVPALTLHNILNALDFGLMDLDERRVVAIRQGLKDKDGIQKTDVRGQLGSGGGAA